VDTQSKQVEFRHGRLTTLNDDLSPRFTFLSRNLSDLGNRGFDCHSTATEAGTVTLESDQLTAKPAIPDFDLVPDLWQGNVFTLQRSYFTLFRGNCLSLLMEKLCQRLASAYVVSAETGNDLPSLFTDTTDERFCLSKFFLQETAPLFLNLRQERLLSSPQSSCLFTVSRGKRTLALQCRLSVC
jgi:hypothetical protein